METNVDRLNALGLLGDVRQRLGAEDATDEIYDRKIESMNAMELMGCVSGWNLGDNSWATDYISQYFELVSMGAPMCDIHKSLNIK